MPPRLNKRQQRELEELEDLASNKNPTIDDPLLSSDDNNDAPTGGGPSKPRSAFATFLATEELDESDDENGGEVKAAKSKKSKKKKKKTPSAAALDSPAPSSTPASPSPVPAPSKTHLSTSQTPLPKNEKKSLKKARAKEKKAKGDEIDQALAELGVKYTVPTSNSGTSTHPSASSHHHHVSLPSLLAPHLATLPQHLDPTAEMRKFFGSKVVRSSTSSSPSASSSSIGPGKSAAARSVLTRPQGTWWPAKLREGLSVRALGAEEVMWDEEEGAGEKHGEKEKWWTVEYDKRYRSVTKAFMGTVQSGDPQGFYDLLSKLPYHADTLLQLSEVYRHREEHAQAVDFVDRALFTYERAFVGSFNFTSGLNRLDFSRVESRPFFLAVHRDVIDLQRRGCVRTAFEFARLLYALDPWGDPHGALFHLDFLAIKCGIGQWILDVWDIFEERRRRDDGGGERKGRKRESLRADPGVLPGWAYARALAMRILEGDKDHAGSTQALRDAIMDFPSVLPLLADKLDIALPGEIRGHPSFKIETDNLYLSPSQASLHALSHIYAQRSSPLWKDKDHAQWLLSTATSILLPLYPSPLPPSARLQSFLALYTPEPPRTSIYRHLMIVEGPLRRLFSFIPRTVLERKSLSCDPLPPSDARTVYDAAFFEGVEDAFGGRGGGGRRTRRARQMDERRLAQMVPDGAFRAQLQAFFEAQPNLAERFPGGIVQFAQMVAQLPEDVLENMMMVEAMGMGPAAGGAGGVGVDDRGMPGAFADVGEQGEEGQAGHRELPRIAEEHEGDEWEAAEEEGEDEDEQEDDEEEEEELENALPMPRVIRNILGRFFGRAPPEESSSEDEEGPLDPSGVD